MVVFHFFPNNRWHSALDTTLLANVVPLAPHLRRGSVLATIGAFCEFQVDVKGIWEWWLSAEADDESLGT